jgi:microcystin-dependent protein
MKKLTLLLTLLVSLAFSNTTTAQEPFLGEIRMFAGNFAPRGWALCDGQILSISQNTALFSLLGTIYGGDGRTSFALPDLRGRAPIHAGRGDGLSNRRLGSRGGVETVTLNVTQIPSHNHAAAGTVTASFAPPNFANSFNPTEASFGAPQPGTNIYTDGASNVNMKANNVNVTVGNTGGTQSHQNMAPYLTVNYIIALQGIFPSRS